MPRSRIGRVRLRHIRRILCPGNRPGLFGPRHPSSNSMARIEHASVKLPNSTRSLKPVKQRSRYDAGGQDVAMEAV